MYIRLSAHAYVRTLAGTTIGCQAVGMWHAAAEATRSGANDDGYTTE